MAGRAWLARAVLYTAGGVALAALAVALAATAVDAAPAGRTLLVHTSPAMPGTGFELEGRSYTTDAHGVARLTPVLWSNLDKRIKVRPPPSDGKRRAQFVLLRYERFLRTATTVLTSKSWPASTSTIGRG